MNNLLAPSYILQPGSVIDIIAPAGKIHDPQEIKKVVQLIEAWGYRARLGKNLLGNHAFYSNTLELRFEDLKYALFDKSSSAIWCYRGGYGSLELLPLLASLAHPPTPKVFIGFSDITILHIFFLQRWGWRTIHGPSVRQIAVNEIDLISQNLIKDLLIGTRKEIIISDLLPLNAAAEAVKTIQLSFIGGNLAVITHTLGTPYQINAKNKLLLLEDVNEPAYKVKRMLTHLELANIFNDVAGIVFGEFNNNFGQEELTNTILMEFAKNKEIPILKTSSIGHGKINYPIPLGTLTTLTCGKQPKIEIQY